jgi:oxygen-independent coproporphyrinogen III oxidase
MNAVSIYVHVPFCRSRCSYCDFNTYTGQEAFIPAYVDALCQEAEKIAASAGRRLPVHTVYFGGGTPSLLPADGLEKILLTLHEHYQLKRDAEITLEANPGTVSLAYLQQLRDMGINRLSYGMQSANADDLRRLNRRHDLNQVYEAANWARRAGFDNLSLDLIFGVPEQTLESWQQTLEHAFAIAPEHLSLYSLILEQGTPLDKWVRCGLVNVIDDDTAAQMYELACDQLDANGYRHYEISNWAKPAINGQVMTCKHNLQYWRNQPYIGLGAGAHGFAGGVRTANVHGIQAYITQMECDDGLPFPRSSANSEVLAIDLADEMNETMMVGLRLIDEGIASRDFLRRYGVTLETAYGKPIRRLVQQGLLEWVGKGETQLRLTKRGRLIGNQVFMEFVD